LFLEETTPPADEKVCANTDTAIRGARHHSLLTQSCTSWVETMVQDKHNKPHIKKETSMQRLNLDTSGIIVEDDEEKVNDAGADGKMAPRGAASTRRSSSAAVAAGYHILAGQKVGPREGKALTCVIWCRVSIP
jgi:lysyl-tRNA synthetase class I